MSLEKITGIVTDVIKHSDRHNVITLFTRSHGRIPFLSAAGNGRSARIRNASLMPLSVISADINLNSNRELQFLGKFQRVFLWKDLYFNPYKSAMAMFLSEFINNYVRNSGSDPALWDFILEAVSHLDKIQDGIANFHLAFLIEFSKYVGVRPDLSDFRPDAMFDMRGGTVSILPPAHRDFLTIEQTSRLPLLMRMNLRTAPLFRFNASQRRELLALLLRYYGLHFPGLSNLKTPSVLAEVFG